MPDPAKAQQLLGFSAKVSLEEGLLRTIEWQKTVRGVSSRVVVGA